MQSRILLDNDIIPEPHHHPESHLQVDPTFVPRRLKPLDWVNGAREIQASVYRSMRRESLKRDDHNLTDTSETHWLPTPYCNGLVEGMLEAFEFKRHLVLSPDEVLANIISQFSFWANKVPDSDVWINRDLLNDSIRLTVPYDQTPQTIPCRDIASQLAEFVKHNLKNPGLEHWLDPGFTTTKDAHRVIYATLMLGKCTDFEPGALIRPEGPYDEETPGGLPVVTLKGEESDWWRLRNLARPLERYTRFNPDMKRWYELLEMVLKHIAFSYARPNSHSAVNFWKCMIHQSGKRWVNAHLTGWASVFTYWRWDKPKPTPTRLGMTGVHAGVALRRIALESIQPAYACVDVSITQKKIEGEDSETKAQLAAGTFGVQFLTQDESRYHRYRNHEINPLDLTATQPLASWFLFTKPQNYKFLPLSADELQ